MDTVLRSEKHYCRGAQSFNLIIVVEVWLSYVHEGGWISMCSANESRMKH